MIEAETIDAASTIRLLESIEALYPLLVMIHVYLDPRVKPEGMQCALSSRQACTSLAGPAGPQDRTASPPSRGQALNPIERFRGVMHKHLTHNKCYATSREFAGEVLTFLRETVPQNWAELCDSVTDNFRAINPKDFRVLA